MEPCSGELSVSVSSCLSWWTSLVSSCLAVVTDAVVVTSEVVCVVYLVDATELVVT